MTQNLIILEQLIISIFLGSLIGLEREISKKPAGFRTYSLVSLGATIFTIISEAIAFEYQNLPGFSFDPSRIVSQIIVGVGFIGAGVIIYQKSKIRGTTTAASLWVTAAIGMAVGFKLYTLAILSTCLVLIILIVFYFFIENRLEKKVAKKNEFI